MDKKLDKKMLERELREEGFAHVFYRPEPPQALYAEHVHRKSTTRIVVDGQISIVDSRGERTYQVGDRFDLPAGEPHSTRVGPTGCMMIVGSN